MQILNKQSYIENTLAQECDLKHFVDETMTTNEMARNVWQTKIAVFTHLIGHCVPYSMYLPLFRTLCIWRAFAHFNSVFQFARFFSLLASFAWAFVSHIVYRTTPRFSMCEIFSDTRIICCCYCCCYYCRYSLKSLPKNSFAISIVFPVNCSPYSFDLYALDHYMV